MPRHLPHATGKYLPKYLPVAWGKSESPDYISNPWLQAVELVSRGPLAYRWEVCLQDCVGKVDTAVSCS
jgi:hypothetical protein